MSLIYEALRKSEEQRRLGETPTLTTPPLFATRPRRRAWPYVAVAIGVVLLAGGTWWLGRLSSRDAPATAVVARPTTAGTTTTTTTAPPSAPSAAPSVAPPTPTATLPVAPASTPGAAASAAATPEDVDARAGVPAELQRKLDSGEIFANNPAQLKPLEPTRDSSYVPPEAALPEPLPDLENASPSAAATTVMPAPTAEIPVGGAEAPTAPPPLAPAFIPSDPATSATPRTVDAGAALPYLFELPLPTRRELPALKLNMHVYSADIARRFVIVDGTRATEGGELATGLTVVEIRADGAILEFRGQRFLLPRGN